MIKSGRGNIALYIRRLILSKWINHGSVENTAMKKLLNCFRILVAGLVLAGTAARAEPVDTALEPIQPIEMPTDLDVPKVELGKKLFFDPRLSLSGWISCNSCHNLSMGG